MSHLGKTNAEEYGGAGQASGNEPVNLYDKGHGTYSDEAVRDDKRSKEPPAQPSPIGGGGS